MYTPFPSNGYCILYSTDTIIALDFDTHEFEMVHTDRYGGFFIMDYEHTTLHMHYQTCDTTSVRTDRIASYPYTYTIHDSDSIVLHIQDIVQEDTITSFRMHIQ